MAGLAGFEPTSDGVKVRCLTAWLYPKKKMEESGFEPLNPKERIYSPSRLATSLFLHKWRETESNCRHMELQSIALPTELLNRNGNNNGGLDGNRTRDLLRDRQAC